MEIYKVGDKYYKDINVAQHNTKQRAINYRKENPLDTIEKVTNENGYSYVADMELHGGNIISTFEIINVC